MLSADHQIKADELRKRYAALRQRVQDETAKAEAHGHHGRDLEQSVRQRLDSLEIDLD